MKDFFHLRLNHLKKKFMGGQAQIDYKREKPCRFLRLCRAPMANVVSIPQKSRRIFARLTVASVVTTHAGKFSILISKFR